MNVTPAMAYLFQRSNPTKDIGDRLIRLANLTTPNMLFASETPDRREVTRANRSLPVVVAIWENDEPVAEDAITAITRDIGKTGFSIILRQPLRAERLVTVFWMPNDPTNMHVGEPLYTLVRVVNNTPLGGGFWRCGLEVEEMLLQAEHPSLERLNHLVQKLAPPEAQT